MIRIISHMYDTNVRTLYSAKCHIYIYFGMIIMSIYAGTHTISFSKIFTDFLFFINIFTLHFLVYTLVTPGIYIYNVYLHKYTHTRRFFLKKEKRFSFWFKLLSTILFYFILFLSNTKPSYFFFCFFNISRHTFFLFFFIRI